MSTAEAYVALVLVGVLPTLIWRMLGVWLSHGIDDSSEIFQWVRAVATATLAAVVAKLAFMPSGALAQVPWSVRAAGLALGLAAYFIFRRSVVAGVIAGVGSLIIASGFL